MKRIIIALLILCNLPSLNQIWGQCTPAPADNCADANVLCSLDEVNGYTCKNPDYSNPTGCSPLCPSGGSSQNTNWWAFVTNGGNVCITLTYSNCTVNMTGVQYGIWGDCSCGESIFCDPSCTGGSGTKTACGVLEPCKTYYLFVDGCSGDVCDFTLTTSGGGAPKLPPLGNIMGPTMLCKGACNVEYTVSVGTGACKPAYQWTLDGTDLGLFTDKIKLDFPDEGKFILCVTAIIGNPQSGSICDQAGPKCITIMVTQEKDRKAGPRIVCFENAPIVWQGQQITASGEYTQHFKDKNCCEYDSVVTFLVTDKPNPGTIYFLGCPGDTYKDPTTGRTFSQCQDPIEIPLSKATQPYRCDSSYNLYAAFLNGSGRMREYCQGGMILCEVIPIDKTCPVAGYFTEGYEYKWYRKNDPGKTSLGVDEFIEVDKKDDYCVDITMTGRLDVLSKKCTFTVCEQFNEDDFKYKTICPKGDLQLCVGKVGTYSVDTIFPADARHIWSVSGGVILTQNPIASKTIDVLWNFDPSPNKEYDGIICYHMESACPETPECCINVKIKVAPQPNAGPDISICGLTNNLKGKYDVGNGVWTQISGPNNATLTPPNSDKPQVDVPTYGRYGFVLTETSLGCTTSDTVYADFNSSPGKAPTFYICSGDNTGYTFTFDIIGGKPKYKLIKGNGKIDSTTNTYISNFTANGKSDTVIVRDANGCEFIFIHDKICQCTNDIGDLDLKPIELCEDGTVNIIYDKSKEKLDANPRDTVVFFYFTNPGNPWGSRVSFLNSLNFTKQAWMQFGVTYYVGARLGRANGKGDLDLLLGCIKDRGGVPFTFFEIPRPNAGADQAICGTGVDMQGVQSLNGTKLKWSEKNGRAAIIDKTADATTHIDALDGYGKYIFVLEEDNNNGLCVKTDEVEITFNPNPLVENLDKVCLNSLGGIFNIDERYLAKADITTGTPPYVLVIPPSSANGKIVGNKYCSDTLPSLTDFIVLIRDANGCETNLFQDNYNCNCGIIYAGQLDTLLTRVCQDKCVPIKNLVPEIIDPTQDIAMYVVHKGNYRSPADVIDTLYSANDVICFDPKKMKLGAANPIFVTRVVGDDVAPKDGVVDTKDPCQRASNNMKIVFEPYATPLAGPDNQICGLNYKFDGQLTFGNATWKLISGPGTATIVDPTDPTSGLTVSVKGKYTFELEGDNFGCIGKDLVDITFVDAPKFQPASIQYECDNTAENYRIKITAELGDRPTWNLTGKFGNGSVLLNGAYLPNSDTWQSDWIPSGSNFDLSIKDINDCSTDLFSGTHICNCITAPGVVTLAPKDLCADATTTATYVIAPGVLDGNDVFRYVLYDGLPNNPTGGTIITFNSSGIFTFDPMKMVLGKTYYVAVYIGNLNVTTGNVDLADRCFQSTPGIPVTWYKYPVSKISGPSRLSCNVTSITLDGAGSVSGSGDNLLYTWKPFNANTSSINITTPGTYTLDVIDPRAGCPHTSTFVVDIDTTSPKVAIDPPLELTCARTTVNLDGNKSDKGAIYTPTWTGGAFVSGSNTYLSTVDKIGTYTLTVQNTVNGCKNNISQTVTEDKAPPTPDLKQIGDLTCTVNQVVIDGSGSTFNSGTTGTYTWIGNVISGQGTNKVTIGKPGGSFILEVKDAKNGCLSRDTIKVIEIGNPLADIVATPENPKCFGDRNGKITVDDVLDANGKPLTNLQYSINGGPYSNNRTFSNLAQGSYTISVRDANGCLLAEKEQLIEPSKLGIEVIRSIFVDQGTLVKLDSLLLNLFGGTKNANGEYKDTTWFNLDQQIDWESKLHYIADTTREFLITGIDASGCTISERVKVLVRIIKDVWWPSIINPTSSVIDNSHFNLYGKRVRNIKTLQIFDRWGELVYSSNNLQDGNKVKGLGWNGEFRGEKALPGVYAFYAEVQYEGSAGTDKFKGDFTLVR